VGGRLEAGWLARRPTAYWRLPTASKRASRPVSRVLYGAVSRARWPFLWDGNCVPPLATNPGDGPETGRGNIAASGFAPIRSCSRRGLPCLERRRPSGALLPHPFTLAAGPKDGGGLLSVALSLGSPPPDLIRRRVSVEPGLSSARESSGHPAGWLFRAIGVATRNVKKNGRPAADGGPIRPETKFRRRRLRCDFRETFGC
jgi:hypothetical protein